MSKFDCWAGIHWWVLTSRTKFERVYRCLRCGHRGTVGMRS